MKTLMFLKILAVLAMMLMSVLTCVAAEQASQSKLNKDVEVDEKAMEELTGKYDSQGVPVIIIGTGKDEVVMKGFTPELFEESLKKARLKK